MPFTVSRESVIEMIRAEGGYSQSAAKAIYEFLDTYNYGQNSLTIDDIDFGEIREYRSVEDAISHGEDINPDPMAEYAWGERIEDVIELGTPNRAGWATGNVVVITTRWHIG